MLYNLYYIILFYDIFPLTFVIKNFASSSILCTDLKAILLRQSVPKWVYDIWLLTTFQIFPDFVFLGFH